MPGIRFELHLQPQGHPTLPAFAGMKILRIITSADPVSGGPIEAALKTDHALLRMGHSVQMVTLDRANAPWLKSIPNVVALGPAVGGYRYAPRLLPWLREHEDSFDAVIIDGLWQYPSLALKSAFRRKTPYFVFAHGMLDPWFKWQYPLKHLKKMLYWHLFQERFLRGAAAVLFTCEQERLRARRSFRPYRVREGIAPYCVAAPADVGPASVERFLNAHPELRDKRIVLFLGRIHPKKGCDLLLDAFAAIAHRDERLRLVMAGPDEARWRHELEKRAETLGVAERISWPGMLHGQEKWGAFMAAEIFSLPSHQENFGIAVTEALSVGTPVVISDKVNIWPEIQAAGAGIVDSDTLAGTRTALAKWFDLSPADQRRMRVAAKQCFENQFETTAAVSALINLMSKEKGNEGK